MKTLLTIIKSDNRHKKKSIKSKTVEKPLYFDNDGILKIGKTKIAICNIDEIKISKDEYIGYEKLRKDKIIKLNRKEKEEIYYEIKNLVLESFVTNKFVEIEFEEHCEFQEKEELKNCFGGKVRDIHRETEHFYITNKLYIGLKNWI